MSVEARLWQALDEVEDPEIPISVAAMDDVLYRLVEQPLHELDEIAGLAAGTTARTARSTPTLSVVPPTLDDALPRATEPDRPAVRRFHGSGTLLRTEVRELERESEVVLADRLHHGLEVVLGLAGHADLIALNLMGDE